MKEIINTRVVGLEELKEVYVKRKWACFTWLERKSSTSVNKELYIYSSEMPNIYYNDVLIK